MGNIISPIVVNSVNVHDTKLFYESFTDLVEIADDLLLDLNGSYLTLDTGFDSFFNKNIITEHGMIPVVKPNIGARKNREEIYRIRDQFEGMRDVYSERYKIERCFAWEDKYRKLVIRYEKLQSTFMGFRYLGYSMINFRSVFGKE